MAEMWMVRAGEKAFLIDEFLKRGYVAIGWCEMGDFTKIHNKDELARMYDSTWPDEKPGRRRSSISQIYKFLFGMKIGDWMVTYNPELRTYHLGTIKSDCYFKPEEQEDYCARRDIQWSYKVKRDTLGLSTRNSLGAISALFAISGIAMDDFLAVAIGKAQPTTPAPELANEEEDIKELKEDIKSRAFEFIKDKIQNLDWAEVQELLAGILRGMGYKARVAAPGPDRGADVIASPDGLGLEQPRIRAEVKHRTEAIGAPSLRSFIGGLRPNDRGLYVSTGGFTKEARYEADRAQIPVTLIDIDELAILLIDNYDRLDADARALIPMAKIYWPAE
jgi:restriction system protein